MIDGCGPNRCLGVCWIVAQILQNLNDGGQKILSAVRRADLGLDCGRDRLRQVSRCEGIHQSMKYTPLRTSPSSSLASRILAGRSSPEMLAPIPLSTQVSSSSSSLSSL
jgi:hypothetical protein